MSCRKLYSVFSILEMKLAMQSLEHLEKGFQSGQNLHELLQSDILCLSKQFFRIRRTASKRAVPNRGCAYHGDATKHREEADVEGTHISAKVWSPMLGGTRTRCEGVIPELKTASTEVF